MEPAPHHGAGCPAAKGIRHQGDPPGLRTERAPIDIWPTLADANGNFQYSLIAPGGKTVALRTRDGVHIAPAGNKILAKAVLPHLERMLQPLGQPEMPTPLPETVFGPVTNITAPIRAAFMLV